MDLNAACQALAGHHPNFFERIIGVYQQMDAAYATVAGHYGFTCNGCEDSCCLTRFRHHTLIEYAYLLHGFTGLEAAVRTKVCALSFQYRQVLQDAEARGAVFRHWCPLNRDGRCILYAFRPMICRLHGLPHHLRHPTRGLIQGPGCHIFKEQCQSAAPRPLDRSKLYAALAGLERDVRQGTGFRTPIGMTVADMILAFPCSDLTKKPHENG
ncbi:MAG: hypothetical protein JJV98_06970 [Desulfosarcina sp.]|nr:hypothetical protein [Desulfobacterales bacterium]